MSLPLSEPGRSKGGKPGIILKVIPDFSLLKHAFFSPLIDISIDERVARIMPGIPDLKDLKESY
jgi:hypothetical protein